MSDRVNAGDISVNISVFRGGEQLKASDGGYNLVGFLRAWEIYESIESATLEATFVFEDSAGISNIFTGSEEIKFTINGSVHVSHVMPMSTAKNGPGQSIPISIQLQEHP